jgi:ABC-type transporter Mla MlaB component
VSHLSYKLPSKISYDNLRSFLEFRVQTEALFDCKVSLDCSGLTYVDPTGLCLLKHWFYDLDQRGVTLQLLRLPIQKEAYLRRLDLFDGVSARPFPDRTSGNGRNDHEGNIIEITTLRDQREIQPAATRIAATIVHGMSIDDTSDPDGMRASLKESVEENLEYVFTEILLNALTHGRNRGFGHAHVNLAAQYFPSRDTLEVAVVDNGCGLLETLQGHRRMEGDVSHRKAILIARQARVSCNRDAELSLDTRNQGIGLTVCADMAIAARGNCGVFSGTSRQTFLQGNQIFGRVIPAWTGTGAVFRFERTGLTKVDKGSIIAALPGFRPVNSLRFG